MKRILVSLLCSLALAGPAAAGDVLWYLGHSGHDEGHNQIIALLGTEGAVVDVSAADPIPHLAPYRLVFIVMPGFFDPADFFDAVEKARINAWLADQNHRIVMVGDWDGFYQGQAVMNDLLAAIGNPIIFDPGAYDTGCNHCAGPLGDPNPLTAGIAHVCYHYTPTWDPAHGVPLAYPESPAPGPYIVDNGTNTPCITGLGDGNIITDLCSPLDGGDPDTETFAKRLYTIRCSGEPVQVDATTWGRMKSFYR
jgi:hypothetical protein